MLVLEMEACQPLRNDLKSVSVIEMTFLYDARYSFVLLRQKMRFNSPHTVQTGGFVWENGRYLVGRFIFTKLSWSVSYRSSFSQRGRCRSSGKTNSGTRRTR